MSAAIQSVVFEDKRPGWHFEWEAVSAGNLTRQGAPYDVARLF
jgi:hypothetical protein